METEPKKEILNKIIGLINCGKLNKALNNILIVTENFPNSVLAYNILGVIHIELENFDKALDALKIAINLKPNYEIALNNIGLVYLKVKSFDDAICYFEKATNTDKNYIDPYLLINLLPNNL